MVPGPRSLLPQSMSGRRRRRTGRATEVPVVGRDAEDLGIVGQAEAVVTGVVLAADGHADHHAAFFASEGGEVVEGRPVAGDLVLTTAREGPLRGGLVQAVLAVL